MSGPRDRHLLALVPWPPRINESLKVPEIEEREARMLVHFSGLGGLAPEPRLYSSLLG